MHRWTSVVAVHAGVLPLTAAGTEDATRAGVSGSPCPSLKWLPYIWVYSDGQANTSEQERLTARVDHLMRQCNGR